jgi:hypothetical protein
MKRREFFRGAAGSVCAFGLTGVFRPITLSEAGADYQISGVAFDGCACRVPCPCAFAGSFKEGCNNIGVISLRSGMYKGTDLSGAKLVQAGLAGQWARIYIDSNDAQRDAATAFAKAVFAPYGKAESIKAAKIDLAGHAGKYRLSVDGGQIVELMTEPMVGADGKSPITVTNVYGLFGPTFTQARTIKGSLRDGGRSFTFADSNSMFTDPLSTSGTFT